MKITFELDTDNENFDQSTLNIFSNPNEIMGILCEFERVFHDLQVEKRFGENVRVVKEVRIETESDFFVETKYTEIPKEDSFLRITDNFVSVYKDAETAKEYEAKSVIDVNLLCNELQGSLDKLRKYVDE